MLFCPSASFSFSSTSSPSPQYPPRPLLLLRRILSFFFSFSSFTSFRAYSSLCSLYPHFHSSSFILSVFISGCHSCPLYIYSPILTHELYHRADNLKQNLLYIAKQRRRRGPDSRRLADSEVLMG